MANKDNKVKQARRDKGFTQKEVARKVNTTERNYQRIEAGQNPGAPLAVAIAEALGKEPKDLFSKPA